MSSVARGGVMGHLHPPKPKLLCTRYNGVLRIYFKKYSNNRAFKVKMLYCIHNNKTFNSPSNMETISNLFHFLE